MFMVSEPQAARIRAEFEQGGSAAAARELRRMFPGLPDNAETMESARTIAGWTPRAPPVWPEVGRKRD